jgi:hypothetical protein
MPVGVSNTQPPDSELELALAEVSYEVIPDMDPVDDDDNE